MRKAIAIVIQILIFVGAWFVMVPDQLVDNTYIFGLVGNVELVKGNADWVMMTAGILSVFNIWIWWPKVKVANTSSVMPASTEDTKSAETGEK